MSDGDSESRSCYRSAFVCAITALLSVLLVLSQHFHQVFGCAIAALAVFSLRAIAALYSGLGPCAIAALSPECLVVLSQHSIPGCPCAIAAI